MLIFLLGAGTTNARKNLNTAVSRYFIEVPARLGLLKSSVLRTRKYQSASSIAKFGIPPETRFFTGEATLVQLISANSHRLRNRSARLLKEKLQMLPKYHTKDRIIATKICSACTSSWNGTQPPRRSSSPPIGRKLCWQVEQPRLN